MGFIFRRSLAALLAVVLVFGAVAFDAHAVSSNEESGYGYSFLTPEEQAVYAKIRDAILNVEKTVNLSALTEAQLYNVMEMVIADHPELFWFTGAYGYNMINGMIYKVQFRYELNGTSATKEDILEANEAFRTSIAHIISDMKLEAGHDDYSKAVWLHDRLAELVTYKFGSNHQSAYGAIVDGEAVCAGYARSYQYLLKRAGIQAWTVKGTSINPATGYPENHAWNLVWLNGKCVYIDVTWDDQDPELFHLYFGCNYSEISVGHYVEEKIYEPKLPDCKCTNMEYFSTYRPDCDVTESITVQKVVNLLTPNGDGKTWTASLFDSGDHHVDLWLRDPVNLRAILNRAFGVGKYSLRVTSLGGTGQGREHHLSITNNEIGKAFTLSGTIKSAVSSKDPVTIKLIANKTVIHSTTVTGNNATYSIANVVAGTYTVQITKNNHITREFSVTVEFADVTMDFNICSVGDVSGDGKLNMKDWSRMYDHINEKSELEGYALECADINGDGKVNMKDWSRMYAHVSETDPLW